MKSFKIGQNDYVTEAIISPKNHDFGVHQKKLGPILHSSMSLWRQKIIPKQF